MRLYRTPSGRWFGTQADARRACLDEAVPSTAWNEIDVPTDKPGLISWLHMNCGPASVEAAKAEIALDKLRDRAAAAKAAPPRDMSAGANLARMEAVRQGVDIDLMIETIATAGTATLKRFAGAVAVRFGELAKFGDLTK